MYAQGFFDSFICDIHSGYYSGPHSPVVDAGGCASRDGTQLAGASLANRSAYRTAAKIRSALPCLAGSSIGPDSLRLSSQMFIYVTINLAKYTVVTLL